MSDTKREQQTARVWWVRYRLPDGRVKRTQLNYANPAGRDMAERWAAKDVVSKQPGTTVAGIDPASH